MVQKIEAVADLQSFVETKIVEWHAKGRQGNL